MPGFSDSRTGGGKWGPYATVGCERPIGAVFCFSETQLLVFLQFSSYFPFGLPGTCKGDPCRPPDDAGDRRDVKVMPSQPGETVQNGRGDPFYPAKR